MTRARLQVVDADREAASTLVSQAREHLASAAADGVDQQSAYALCYQAVLKAMSGSLLFDGKRVTGGAGGHVVAIREAAASLDLAQDIQDRVDAMRRLRHRVFYDVVEIGQLELEGAMSDAAAVVDAAVQKVGR